MNSTVLNESKKRLVVVGGGFAGLNMVNELANNKYYEVILVDRNNYNYFTPLLYQVATSFLEPSSISYPFRKLLRNKGISFRMGQLVEIDTASNIIYLQDGQIKYEYLVLAAGAKTNFYGNENVKNNSLSIKGVDDALHMRNALLKTLEAAAIASDLNERQKLLTIVIAGGGPTGVELAGMLAEMKRYILAKDYPELKDNPGKIYIVDGGPSLLMPMSDKTHTETYNALVKLGVEVRLNALVKDFKDDLVTFFEGDAIETKTVIWAAGIIANKFKGVPAECFDRTGRMLTDEYNKVKGVENIWAIGDISIQFADPIYPKGHPQLAQVAIQQGRMLGKYFVALSKNKPLKPFKYFDRGEMAIVGRHNAVVDLFKHQLHLSGFAALFVWLFIHLISLVNYNNKVKTLYNWTIAFLTRDQALRMIFRSDNETNQNKNQSIN